MLLLMLRLLKYIIGTFVIIYIVFLAKVFLVDIPALRFINPHSTAMMRARGATLPLHWTDTESIPNYLKQAILTAEDAKFYTHNGVDYEALKNAYKQNLKKKKYARGGSTITMQLARNLYLSSRKNIFRKGLEILVTWRIEQELSKDRILEVYLNVIEFGQGIFGAENAAQHYFKKSLSALSNRELSFLVAIVPSPKKWGHWPPSPYVSRRMALISKRVGRVAETPTPESIQEAIELSVPEEEEETSGEQLPVTTQKVFLDE